MDADILASNVWGFAWYLLPFLAVVLGGAFLWETWLEHVRGAFVASIRWTLLRVVPPPEVFRSPIAMEVFLTSLFQTGGEGNWFDLYWKGKRRPWFALEMVSISGDVRFYIRTQEGFARLVETQLYSQYPGVVIEREDEDYTDEVFYESSKFDWFGAEYKLDKPDPYPIRTYVDYGLVDEDKPELQIDPLSPTIEFLSAVPRGFQAWIQIIVKAHKKEAHKAGTFFGVEDSWQEAAKKEIVAVRDRGKSKNKEGETEVSKPTKRQEFIIEAIERSVGKYGFDTSVRTVSIFPDGALDAEKGFMKAGLGGAFRQFNSLELNGFKSAKTTSVDYPWQDWGGRKIAKMKKKMLEAYRERAFTDEPFVLNTEELATIFHLPSSAVSAPTFGRVQSRRGDPPPNLPI